MGVSPRFLSSSLRARHNGREPGSHFQFHMNYQSFVPVNELERLATDALRCAGASVLQAGSTARALVAAEAQGLASHGLSRVASYVAHLRHGRVDGQAQPRMQSTRPGTVLVDAADGFAYPACEIAVHEVMERARTQGVALAGVANSHHFGAAAWHLEPVARAGLVGLALGNSPAAMPGPGGTRALLGTNPLAAVFPRPGAEPLVMDFALSEVARGRIMMAARRGEPIPPGWALDAQGQPTTDARAALAGTLLPFGAGQGGVKGALLALWIELLATTLTGSRFGAEADSFLAPEGNRARVGQIFLVIDPGGMAGRAVYDERIEALLAALCAEPGVRVPGAQRPLRAGQARQRGVPMPEDLLQVLRDLATGGAATPGV